MKSDDEKVDYTLHYETWHTTTEAHRAYMSHFYKSVFFDDLDLVKKRLGKSESELRVLDFGCGMGLFLNFLRSIGYQNLAGFELDIGQAEAGRKIGLKVDQNDSPQAWLGACSERFDAIFAIDVLEHVPPEDLQSTLVAMRRLLTKGGVLIATVPNANSTSAGRWRYIDWTHRLSFTEHSLAHVLRLSGFDVEGVFPSEIVRFYKARQGFVRRWSERFILKIVRLVRRLEFIGEFGWDEGLEIPLTTNIKVRAWSPAK
ncbi:class I SAM-dependent methyltransferase [bacterium]|nr:class I SAM-dependent methyltransferase [bacterium]